MAENHIGVPDALGARLILAYSFYQQGTQGWTQNSADDLIDWALRECGRTDMANSPARAWVKGQRLAEALTEASAILVLDGLEPMLSPKPSLGTDAHRIVDEGLASLVNSILHQPEPIAFCLISSRLKIHELAEMKNTKAHLRDLPHWTK